MKISTKTQKKLLYTLIAVVFIAFIGVILLFVGYLRKAHISQNDGNAIIYIYLLGSFFILITVLLAVLAYSYLKSKSKNEYLQGRNSLFMNSVVDCVIFCDNDGKIVDFNIPSSEIFGYSFKEAIGAEILDFYATKKDWETVQNAMVEKNFFKGNIVNKKKDGTLFISYLSANVVFDEEGNKTGTVGISRDVTNQIIKEEQLQHIVNNATDIIYTTNIEGIITYVNTSAYEILGYSMDEFKGMSFKNIIHKDYVESVSNHYQEQFKNKSHESYYEFEAIKANGESIWVGQNVRATFSPTDENKITGFIGILRNLDVLKKAELSLQKSEEKYRELVDNSQDLIQSIDPEGKILYVNDSWKHTMGYTDEELKELNLFDFIHKDSRAYCEDLLLDILKSGYITEGEEQLFQMVTKNGGVVLLEGTSSIKFEKGQVKSIQTFLRDITEQNIIEQALKRSEENFTLISNSINDVFFLFNTVINKYEYISPKCEEVIGATPEFFMSGASYSDRFLNETDKERLEKMLKEVVNGSNGHIEYKQRTMDGKIRWIDEKWFPIKNNKGKVVSITGVCRDITDVKEAYNTIVDKNKEISQSIVYAKNIQKSTMPTVEEVTEVLPDSFVFFRSKDVLSGDLYLVENIKSNDNECRAAFIVGDCTGHGVPGGLLSLLCSGLLRESLTNSEINSPALALDFVREKLIRLFRSSSSKYILDGMDAAFCVLDEARTKLYFSGANLSCYIVRADEVLEFKGDKQHIGYSTKMAPFVDFTIDLEKGDSIYLTTDGYVDQFGGERNKKFLKKRFTELILEIKDLSMPEQKTRIEDTFLNWKGDTEQTDDIAMIGIRV